MELKVVGQPFVFAQYPIRRISPFLSLLYPGNYFVLQLAVVYKMQLVPWVRVWLQSVQLYIVTTVEAIRSGTWREQQYQLLQGARQKSQYYYSRNMKRTYTIPGAVTALLLLWYIFSHPLLYSTPYDERAGVDIN